MGEPPARRRAFLGVTEAEIRVEDRNGRARAPEDLARRCSPQVREQNTASIASALGIRPLMCVVRIAHNGGNEHLVPPAVDVEVSERSPAHIFNRCVAGKM